MTSADEDAKVNELLYRRIDLADVVGAPQAALERAPQPGFARYLARATTPFTSGELPELHRDAPAVVGRLFPECAEIYEPGSAAGCSRSSTGCT